MHGRFRRPGGDLGLRSLNLFDVRCHTSHPLGMAFSFLKKPPWSHPLWNELIKVAQISRSGKQLRDVPSLELSLSYFVREQQDLSPADRRRQIQATKGLTPTWRVFWWFDVLCWTYRLMSCGFELRTNYIPIPSFSAPTERRNETDSPGWESVSSNRENSVTKTNSQHTRRRWRVQWRDSL